MTVARSRSPSARRTTCPPLRSMAGKMMSDIFSMGSVEKAFEQRQSVALALFGVKLHAKQIVAGDCGGDFLAVIGGRRQIGGIGDAKMIAVDEIGLTRLNQRRGRGRLHPVPAHMGNLQPLVGDRKSTRLNSSH